MLLTFKIFGRARNHGSCFKGEVTIKGGGRRGTYHPGLREPCINQGVVSPSVAKANGVSKWLITCSVDNCYQIVDYKPLSKK